MSPNRREELATGLLPRLRFKNGKLAFDADKSEAEVREQESKRIKEDAEKFLNADVRQ